ncbi:hypothetical protein HY345_03575 [Candidatus Microgenomates bacterium]|nr:hypothetical protein [Candidatus Microgenomates bacterium]
MTKRSNLLIFLIVVFVGMGIRLLIAWYGLSPLDTDSVYEVFYEIKKGNGIYNDNWVYYNNPPVWGWLINLLGILSERTGVWLSFWSKLPFIFADLGIFLILFYYDTSLPFLKRIFYSGLYFLNPLTIVVSAYQGQLESLFLLPLLVSVLFLREKLNRKKIFVAGLFWGLASCIKIIPFITIPAYVIYLWYATAKGNIAQKFVNIFIFSFGAFIPLILVFLPLFNNLEYVLVRILTYQPPFWGFWGFLAFKKLLELFIPLPISINDLLVSNHLEILFISVFLSIFILLIKKFNLTVNILISFLSVYLLASFFSPHYLLWVVPFLSMVLMEKKFRNLTLFFSYSLASLVLELSWLLVFLAEEKFTLTRWKLISLTHPAEISSFAKSLGELINLPIFLFFNIAAWFCCLLIFLVLIRKRSVTR